MEDITTTNTVPETVYTSKLDMALVLVDSHIAGAQKDLVQFASDFSVNPRYALEWGDKAFLGTARMEYLHQIRCVLVNAAKFVEERGGLTRQEVDACLRSMDRSALHNIKSAGVSGSTSGSHRLMDQARVEVFAEWFEDISRWGVTRENLAVVLEDHLPAEIPVEMTGADLLPNMGG